MELFFLLLFFFTLQALECSNLENLVCLWRILGNQLAQCYVKTDHVSVCCIISISIIIYAFEGTF